MVDIEIYEDTGSVTSSHGSIRTIVTNYNWKSSGDITIPYYLAPLHRPADNTELTCSYTKYLYFKISGTFTKAKNFKIILSAVPGLNTQLFGALTNTYTVPDNSLNGNLQYISSPITLYPRIGGDPSTASTVDAVVSTGTYYTEYLATQLRVNNSNDYDIGNTADLTIQLLLSEY